MIASLVGYIFYHLFKSWKQQKDFNSDLENGAIHTNSLKVYSVVYTYSILNFGTDIQWMKFHFKNNEAYISIGNSVFKNSDYRPFAIKSKNIDSYPIFSRFVLAELRITGNELKIQLKSPSILGPGYKLQVKGISNEDLSLLQTNLSEYCI